MRTVRQRSRAGFAAVLASGVAFTANFARAQDDAGESAVKSLPARVERNPQRFALTKALVTNGVSRGGRSPIQIDAVQRLIVTGQWKTPKPGDTITLPDGSTREWTQATAREDGTLQSDQMRGGYALWTVDSPNERIMLLNARGHGTVYVNGEPRMGDPYDNGSVSLPVKLRAGVNELLFHCPRGPIRAELVDPRAAVSLSTTDVTAPDLVRGSSASAWGGVMVINATETPLDDLSIRCTYDGRPHATVVGQSVPAMSVRKCRFLVQPLPADIDPSITTMRATLDVLNSDGTNGGKPLDTTTIDLKVVGSRDLQRITFRSNIDGSAQYFALRPATREAADNGLILTLHGASVEGHGQAAAYASKEWAHIVAPTNRRPYGFDWEDWGRIDAIEAMEIAKKQLPHDPRRVYLTGHSMGGHGTWQIGVTYPGEFAAIAPSAGWISFESYAGGRQRGGSGDDADPVRAMIDRAANPSRTLELQRSLNGLGVYILHGENDDNVPVEQARTMKEQLAWHKDVQYHEQPGAGHWWGNECVDWPPLMEFLHKHARPASLAIDRVQFITASPGVSASRDWVTIDQQIKAMEFSRVDVTRDVKARTIRGTTGNVARLANDVRDFEGEGVIVVPIDDKVVRVCANPQAAEAAVFLERDGDSWSAVDAPLAPSQKTPARCGPFKAAFDHRMIFVYGTRGTADENAWALAKARFDAETFWYRGNGSVDVIADVDFDVNDAASRDRSVIVYGNADSNAAWSALLHDSPVQMRRDGVTVDQREVKGDDLAAFFVRPRPGSKLASVGVISGTGLAGMRLTDRAPYFVSGAAYPDCLIIGSDMLERGGEGIRCAGFFGNDWSVAGGDFAWRE